MKKLSFEKLAIHYPEQIMPRMLERYKKAGQDIISVGIMPTAVFDSSAVVYSVNGVGEDCSIGPNVVLKDGTKLGDCVTIEAHTVLEEDVFISAGFRLNKRAYFARSSGIVPHPEPYKLHQYARFIYQDATIGPSVMLPHEVQLGENALIPTQASIGEIGRFGDRQRMVTIYGSDEGPRYSVGCQFGIGIDTFKDRVHNNTETSAKSAADYRTHMQDIEDLGMSVQAAYDREENLINDLRIERAEALWAAAGLPG